MKIGFKNQISKQLLALAVIAVLCLVGMAGFFMAEAAPGGNNQSSPTTTTGGTIADDPVEIDTASELYSFMTNTTQTYGVLTGDITDYNTASVGIMYIKSQKDLDLGSYTFSVLSSTTTKTRPFYLYSASADLTIYNGTLIAGEGTTETTTQANGAYGVIDGASTSAKLYMHEVTVYSAHYNAMAVRVYGESTIENCIFYASVGGAIDCNNSAVSIVNCTVAQTGISLNGYANSAVSSANGADVTVEGCNFDCDGYAMYVYNTGGSITVSSTTYDGEKGAIRLDNTTTGCTSEMYITGGTYTGDITVGTSCILEVSGGTFTDESVANYLAADYLAKDNGDGTWTVGLPEPIDTTISDITLASQSITLTDGTGSLTLVPTVTASGETEQDLTEFIVWSIKYEGDTGAALDGNTLTVNAAGKAIITATVEDGMGDGIDYIKHFIIDITEAATEDDESGSTGETTAATVNVSSIVLNDGGDITLTTDETLTIGGTGDGAITVAIEPTDSFATTDIAWTVYSDGGTGMTIDGTTITATAAGRAIIRATITDGLGSGTDYVKQFVVTVTAASEDDTATATVEPITNITLSTTTFAVGELDLSSTNVTITPDAAEDAAIVWSVKSAGTTGMTIDSDGTTVTATDAGTAIITATVTGAGTNGGDYVKNFIVKVTTD